MMPDPIIIIIIIIIRLAAVKRLEFVWSANDNLQAAWQVLTPLTRTQTTSSLCLHTTTDFEAGRLGTPT